MNEHRLSVPRSARYFTRGTPGGEVWFVLHGYGQLAAPFLEAFAPLDDGARLIVAPEGLSRFYVSRGSQAVGATWMTREDRLAEIADYVRYLDAVRAEVLGGASGPPVQVLGFSQGASTATRWAVRGVHPVRRLVLWGGEVPPDPPLDDADARERLRGTTLTLVAGRGDQYVTEKVLARDTGRLDEAGIPYRVMRYGGGHDIDAEVLRQLVLTP